MIRPNGWLGALKDERLSHALGLIHRQPDEDWTVESLAAKVGMSRSALFSRFSERVGEPPASYVTRWRIHLACRALIELIEAR
jgi:AraC-like DNA-binding protein